MTLLGFALLAVAALTACSKERPKRPDAAIVSSSTTPGSPFRTQLQLDPQQPKDGEPETFIVSITDAGGRPVTGAKVTGDLVMPVMDMGKNSFPLREQEAGVYRGSGTANMAGEWEVQFTIALGGMSAKHGYHVVFEEAQ